MEFNINTPLGYFVFTLIVIVFGYHAFNSINEFQSGIVTVSSYEGGDDTYSRETEPFSFYFHAIGGMVMSNLFACLILFVWGVVTFFCFKSLVERLIKGRKN